MGTSVAAGYVAHAASMFGDQYPISAALYHDTLDSALHLLDESAQVRVNWPARSTSHYAPADGSTVGTWYPLAAYSVPISVRGDGTSFRLRVRLTAAMSAANSGTFRAVLSSALAARPLANFATAGTPHTLEASTSATTPTVLAPASDVIYMTADAVHEARVYARAYDAVSGASPIDVSVCDAVLSIWGKTSNAAATPRLFGVDAAEFIGT